MPAAMPSSVRTSVGAGERASIGGTATQNARMANATPAHATRAPVTTPYLSPPEHASAQRESCDHLDRFRPPPSQPPQVDDEHVGGHEEHDEALDDRRQVDR